MPRNITQAMIDALESPTPKLAYLINLDFQITSIYWWTGRGDILHSGNTYKGVEYLEIPEFSGETAELEATKLTLNLIGISTELRSLILNNFDHSLRVGFFLAAFDSNGQIVSNPYQIFSGFFDTCDFVDSPNSMNVQLVFVNAYARLFQNEESRYTNESQQNVYPGDLGFAFIPSLEKWSGFWGIVPTDPRKKPGRKDKKRNIRRRNRRQ